MIWDEDPLGYEKYLVLDAIIKFSEAFEGKSSSDISMSELTDFIELFFKKRK